MSGYISGFPGFRSLFSIRYLLIMVLAAVSFACASDSSSAMRKPTGVTIAYNTAASSFSKIKKVVVLDFFERGFYGQPGKAYDCHITGLNFAQGKVRAGSGRLVADQFRFRLFNNDISVVSKESTMDALKGVDPELLSGYEAALGIAVGSRLNADAVVMGSVMRFEELEGTKLAADKPASVSFSFALIVVREKRILLKAKFEKTQKPLFSNLLDYDTFFRGGMKWQKARQLSDIGVQNIIKSIRIGTVGKRSRQE